MKPVVIIFFIAARFLSIHQPRICNIDVTKLSGQSIITLCCYSFTLMYLRVLSWALLSKNAPNARHRFGFAV
jgi:hypothetical protein